MPTPAQIHFAAGFRDEPVLALPRRRALPQMESTESREVAQQSAAMEARQTEVQRPSHPPEEARNSARDTRGEQERLLLQLEARIEERERVVSELESKLHERERDFAETAALLQAREKVFEAARRAHASRPVASISPEEKKAMEALKLELDRHEESIKEQRNALAERERFLDDNEGRLFSKMQEHQEKELELEQKAEDLNAREARIRAQETQLAANPDAVAKTRKWDEFRE